MRGVSVVFQPQCSRDLNLDTRIKFRYKWTMTFVCSSTAVALELPLSGYFACQVCSVAIESPYDVDTAYVIVRK
jgi:hypothetical protein